MTLFFTKVVLSGFIGIDHDISYASVHYDFPVLVFGVKFKVSVYDCGDSERSRKDSSMAVCISAAEDKSEN